MVNSAELIGTTGYMTLQKRCRQNRYRYNRVRLYVMTDDYTHADTIFEHVSYYDRTRARFYL